MYWLLLILIALLWAIGVLLVVWAWCVQAKRADRLAGYLEEGDVPELPSRHDEDATA